MDLNEMTGVLKEALGRLEDIVETLGVDLLGMAENLGKELKEMGYDLVAAAEGKATG
jgi:hypothetical protein